MITRLKSELPFSRTLIVLGVLASLLFSVGEGLRLTPFPASPIHQQHGLDDLASANNEVVSQYGPIDVPTQIRKRTKRQVLDVEVPQVAGSIEAPLHLLALMPDELILPRQLFIDHRFAGRPPPC